jgi:cell division protein FtsB
LLKLDSHGSIASKPRRNGMALPTLNRSQLVTSFSIIVIVLLVGGICWAFARQFALHSQMRVEEERLEAVVETAAAQQRSLVATLEYVRSDQYVEQWAREDAKMARPGEIVIIPLAAPARPAVDLSETGEAQPQEPETFWVKVWEALFGPDSAP